MTTTTDQAINHNQLNSDASNTLLSLEYSVTRGIVVIDLNQDYECILGDLRDHFDDIGHTDEWSYHESSATEILFCRCLDQLTRLVVTLVIAAESGNALARNHLLRAQEELEWVPFSEIIDSTKTCQQDLREMLCLDSPYTKQYIWLKNPSNAAQELWGINF